MNFYRVAGIISQISPAFDVRRKLLLIFIAWINDTINYNTILCYVGLILKLNQLHYYSLIAFPKHVLSVSKILVEDGQVKHAIL